MVDYKELRLLEGVENLKKNEWNKKDDVSLIPVIVSGNHHQELRFSLRTQVSVNTPTINHITIYAAHTWEYVHKSVHESARARLCLKYMDACRTWNYLQFFRNRFFVLEQIVHHKSVIPFVFCLYPTCAPLQNSLDRCLLKRSMRR